jgi:hypothetical protein
LPAEVGVELALPLAGHAAVAEEGREDLERLPEHLVVVLLLKLL